MSALIVLLEAAARSMPALLWQTSLLIVAVGAVTLLLRKASPAWRHALWCVVLLRVCLPWAIVTPASAPLPHIPVPEPVRFQPAEVRVLAPMPDQAHPFTAMASTATSPIPRASRAASPHLSPWAWAGLLWAAGATAMAFLLLLQLGRFRRRLAASGRSDAPLAECLETMRRRAGLTRPVSLRILPPFDEGLGPCITGLFRPTILLPAAMADSWNPEELEPIFLHELAHLRRGDLFVHTLQTLVQIAWWFDPLVWWANARLRHERELLCDDLAVSWLGGTPKRYGAGLFRALQELGPAASWQVSGVGIGESRLVSRFRRLLDLKYRGTRPLRAWARLLILCAGALGALVAAEEPAGVPTPRAEPARPEAPKVSAASPAAMPKRQRVLHVPVRDPDPGAIPVQDLPGDLAGQVQDEAGKPLANVNVSVWHWSPCQLARTDATGSFHLERLGEEAGSVEVQFTLEGFAPFTIIRQPLGRMRAPVVLHRSTFFEGVVTGPGGKPVADALIRADQGPKQAEGVMITHIWTEARSDAEGRYKLLVQDDTYNLEVTAPPGLAARFFKQTIAKGEAVTLNVALQHGVTFRARVIDSETEQPVPGVRFWHWQHPGVEGTSDALGQVEITGMVPGPFEFDVEAKNHVRWWSRQCTSPHNQRPFLSSDGWQDNHDALDFELEPEMGVATILLERGVQVRGRVVDPAGKPVGGATVAPALTGTGSSLTGDTRFSVTTKDDGTFEMLLPAGHRRPYNLMAHDGGYREWRHWANTTLEPMVTEPGEHIDGIELRLHPPSVIRGHVTDEAGHPIAGFEVRARAADKRQNRYYDPSTHTSADGSYELAFVSSGRQELSLVAPAALAGEKTFWKMQTVEVKEGESLKADLVAQPR